MSRTDKQLINDILGAADNLSDLIDKGRANFDANWYMIAAAERQLEIIGEAVNNLSNDFLQSKPNPLIAEARALRNTISHEYADVDPRLVWHAITESVPRLVSHLTDPRPIMRRPSDPNLG